MPVPRGGGARLADALVRLIEDNGGSCRTGAEVDSIVVRDGAAVGVRTAEGETVERRARRDRERHADAALRPPARQTRPTRSPPRARALPLRPGRDADPLRALGAAALGGRRAARADGRRARDARPRRRLARRQRGRARPAAGRADDRVRAAADDRPEPRAGRQGHALDPAAGAAVAREGRRRRRARHRRRHLDGGAPRAVRRPRPGAARAPHPEPRVGRCSRARRSPPPTSRRRTRTSSTATRTRARSLSTRTSSGGRSPAGRVTARRSTGSGTSARAPGRARARRRLGNARRPGAAATAGAHARARGGSPASARS